MASLPYVTAPGNVVKALRGIKSAAQPEKVSQDFVKTILNIRGGSGDQMTAYLRKLGFANSDGTPSDIYTRFRNPTTIGQAALDALKKGYQPLYARNEYMHQLSDDELRGLIIQETGMADDSNVVTLILTAINGVKGFADLNPSMQSKNNYANKFSDEGFWDKVGRYAMVAGKELIEKALWLYYAAQKKETPAWAKLVIFGDLGYFIFPLDAIPDFTPLIGYTDDLGVIVAAAAILAAYIDGKDKAKARKKLKDWFG